MPKPFGINQLIPGGFSLSVVCVNAALPLEL